MNKTMNSWYFNGIRWLITLWLACTLISCSNDDDDSRISLGELSSVYEGSCNHSSGMTGADYAISIPYNGTENDSLGRLLISVTLEDGPTNQANSNFDDFALTDGSGVLTWNGCLLFLDAAWIDFEVRLETTEGEVSGTSTIRLNRTDFDN